jgi:Uncharacterised protein family UPF0102
MTTPSPLIVDQMKIDEIIFAGKREGATVSISPEPRSLEVKTRTRRDVKPGEAAVDQHKRRQVAAVAPEFLRRFPLSCQWRFDLVSVYYDESQSSRPQVEVVRNASLKR